MSKPDTNQANEDELQIELERHGITAPTAKKAKIVSIIKKSTIDTIDDCEAVADGLGI